MQAKFWTHLGLIRFMPRPRRKDCHSGRCRLAALNWIFFTIFLINPLCLDNHYFRVFLISHQDNLYFDKNFTEREWIGTKDIDLSKVYLHKHNLCSGVLLCVSYVSRPLKVVTCTGPNVIYFCFFNLTVCDAFNWPFINSFNK